MRDWPSVVIPKYSRAVFLDRDGTINVDTDYPYRLEDLLPIPEALHGIARLAQLPVHIIVVSNQAGIPLGKFTVEQMSTFNAALRSIIEGEEGRVDAFYYCPEKEPKHLRPDERPSECAKPSPGMLLEAASDFGLNLDKSYMIGDKESDVIAGQRAGCFSIRVRARTLVGQDGDDSNSMSSQHVCVLDSLLEAAELIASRLSS